VRANRQPKRGRVVIDSNVDERVANVVPFVPPIPDHVTDEDMLLALQQIPPHHQEVILLCDVEDLTYRNIRPGDLQGHAYDIGSRLAELLIVSGYAEPEMPREDFHTGADTRRRD
jgi:hypothetical protein